MTRTIKCTNPNCGADIPVPTGVMQVVCKECSTWHFPPPEVEPSDHAFPPSSPPSAGDSFGGYMPPSVSNPAPPNPVVPREEAPPPLSTYDIPEVDPYESPSSPVAVAYEEAYVPPEVPSSDSGISEDIAVGCLVTDSGVRLLLKEGLNIIGRKNADLIINDRTVSRRHCVLEINTGTEGRREYFIYDIGHLEGSPSTNGVFVSGRTLRLQDYERIPLRNGMTLHIGAVGLKLEC